MHNASPCLPLLRSVLIFVSFVIHQELAWNQEEDLIFQQLSGAQNLSSQKFNFFIHQDKQGFVWVPSLNGINRYDGLEIKPYLPNEKDSFALADGTIQSRFFEDQKGNLWFNTVKAIHYYDKKNDNFQRYPLIIEGDTIHNDFQLLYLDTIAVEMWLVVNDTLLRQSINPPHHTVYLGTLKEEFGYGTQVLPIPNSSGFYLLVPLETGWQIRSYIGDRKEEKTYPPIKNPDFAASTFFMESEEILWIGANKGLIKLNLKTDSISIFHKFKDATISDIKGIQPYAEELLIATKEKGLYIFDKKEEQFIAQIFQNRQDAISSFMPTIDQIYIDKDQNLWVSAPGQGVFLSNLLKKRFRSQLQYRERSKLTRSMIKSMALDKQGRIWSLNNDQIVILNPNDNQPSKVANLEIAHTTAAGENPFFIFCDQADRKWVCGQTGLFVCSPSSLKFSKIPVPEESLSDRPVFTYMAQIARQRIIVSTLKSGLYEIHTQNEQHRLSRLPEWPDNTGGYAMIFEADNGHVFISKQWDSLLVFQNTGRYLKHLQSIPFPPMITAFGENKHTGEKWLATDAGLYQMRIEQGSYFLEKDALFPFQPLNGLLIDSLNQLWISSNQGLFCYQPGENWRHFQTSDGLQSLEYNFWSYLETPNGHFAFGGVNGLNLFNPYEVKTLGIAARPAITNILINDEPAPPDLVCDLTGVKNFNELQKITRTFKNRTLSFRFAALEYSDPSANQFRYQMVGVDDDWVNSYKENFARYANLSPGHYTFKVDATNSDGQWSGNPKLLRIYIKPPWYLTWWFQTLAVLASILVIYSIYKARVNQIKRRETFLRKEAEYKQLVAETETAVLRLQMNPHFIFNSMNSISSYILQNEMEKANDYLSRFAKLMRKILELAEKPLITISEEIELLEQYLKTEAMRLEQRFKYFITVPDALDPDEVLIPTMILQPFIENAIWHGISPKKTGQGKIEIQFNTTNNQLVCTVMDNGIGRQAKKTTASSTHQSKALKITNRRLQLLEEKEGQRAYFMIEDLKDEQLQPTGTKVAVTLPLL